MRSKGRSHTDPVLGRVEKLIDETPHLKELTWLATSRLEDETAEGWEMPDIHADTLAFLQYNFRINRYPQRGHA